MTTLNVAGGELFYRQAGADGLADCLLARRWVQPAWTGSTSSATSRTITSRWRVDLRGHGLSTTADPDTCTLQQMAADVGHLIHRLGPAPAVVVGHSYGTRVALLAGQMHPQLVSGVVLVDGSRVWNDGDWSQIAASLAQWRNIGTPVRPGHRRTPDQPLPAPTQERIRLSMKSTSADVLWAITRSSAPWDAFGLPASSTRSAAVCWPFRAPTTTTTRLGSP